MKKYFMKVEEYARTESGKSWKSKPYKTYHEEIEGYQYEWIFDSVKFFRNLGGFERITKTYTCEGYIPTRLTSINPDKTKKVIRYFTPVR